MKKKVITIIALLLCGVAVVFAATATVFNFLQKDKLTVLELIGNGSVWVITCGVIITALVFFLLDGKQTGSKHILKINKLPDSHWLTMKEMRKNSNMTVTKLSELSEVNDGVPLYAKVHPDGKDVDVVLGKPIHTLVIGTTGSGKTSGFVDPTVQVLCRCKTKPGMVITDPKGELFLRHSDSLKKAGYKVQVIDLVDVYHSAKWNPFGGVLKKTVLLQTAAIDNIKGKYYVNNIACLSLEQAEKELQVYKQSLDSEIYSDIQDLIYTVCPVEDKNSPGWQKGARDLIFALALAFWEDVRDGFMQPYQLNLYNLYKNISEYCSGEMEEMKAYFDRRDKFSKTKGLANTVLITQEKTLSSYLTDVIQYFNWMADTGLAALTSGTDVELDIFDEQPNALFLRIPDHLENRYKLAALMITQLYKAFINKADKNLQDGLTKEPELLRNVYFIMDEFVNMPRFESIDKMLRVGRSRKVFLVPIIQDYAGLEGHYTKIVADTIKSNCNIKIFIGTTDLNTAKEYSEMCGKRRVKNVSFSESKDVSVSTSVQEHPLISAEELTRLNDPPDRMGNAVILAFGKYPLEAKYTPLFQAREAYNITPGEYEKREAELFLEKDYFYDIVKRNSFLEESANLQKMQEDDLKNFLSQLEGEEENQTDPTEPIRLRLINRIEKLRGRVSDETLQLLLNANTEDLPKILDKLIDTAQDNKDNYLVFELAFVKDYAKEVIKTIDNLINLLTQEEVKQ